MTTLVKYDMDITHVIRGDDHLNNTPRQINILNALGAKIPEYAHVPMINGHDGKTYGLRATGSVIVFDGFLKLYEEGRDDSDDE